MTEKFSGWKIVAALWLVMFINMAFTSYGAGVIGAFMLSELDIGRSVLGLGFTAFALSQGLSAPLVAWIVGKYGSRLTITCGSLFLALMAFVLAYVTTEGWHYVLAFGVGVGTGVSFSATMPAQACVAQWFSRRRGLALGIVMAATGVGGFVAAPLLNQVILINDGSWRAGWYLVAAGALVSAAVAFLFLRNNPAELGQVQDGVTTAEGATDTAGNRRVIYATTRNWSLREALGTRAKWLIALASIGFVVPISTFLAHGVPHLMDIGHTPASASMAMAMLAICGILGKLGAGFFCDRFEPRHVWCVCLLLTGVGMFLGASALSQAAVYIFALVLGVGYGASLVCWPAMIANYFGPVSFPTMMGMQMPMNTIVSSMSPLLVGFMFDVQGSYVPSFHLVAVFAAATGLLLLLARPPQPRPASVAG